MSIIQKRIVVGGCMVIAAMLLYPPWTHADAYGLIFDPPSNALGINWSRLILQIVSVSIASVGLYFFNSDQG